jgi:hypothetical protein
MTMTWRLRAAAALLFAAGAAHGQLYTATITSGDLEFDLATQAPLGIMGPMLLRPSNLISALEPDASQLNQFLWYYYIQGDPRAYNFNQEGGQQVQTTPDSVTVTQHYSGWDGIQEYTIVGTGANVGYLRSRATVHNLGAAPLVISLIHYADLDDNGTFTDDVADFTDHDVVRVTDSTGPFALQFAADVPVNAWQATPWRDLLTSLANQNQTALNNTGLPFGPGDFTMAWQWDLTVQPGESVTVGDTITIIDTTAPACYANCDGSTVQPILNVNDFICFQQKFAAGDTYANCDGSTTAPVLNVNDFVCFQTRFAAGCTAP